MIKARRSTLEARKACSALQTPSLSFADRGMRARGAGVGRRLHISRILVSSASHNPADDRVQPPNHEERSTSVRLRK